jgi:hypothetical protein
MDFTEFLKYGDVVAGGGASSPGAGVHAHEELARLVLLFAKLG